MKIIWKRLNFGPNFFFSGIFVGLPVKHNRNELGYAKSADSDGLNLRKLTKNIFGLIWTNLVHFWAKTFFSRKSENVTFLDLLKANLMQKIRKLQSLSCYKTHSVAIEISAVFLFFG